MLLLVSVYRFRDNVIMLTSVNNNRIACLYMKSLFINTSNDAGKSINTLSFAHNVNIVMLRAIIYVMHIAVGHCRTYYSVSSTL